MAVEAGYDKLQMHLSLCLFLFVSVCQSFSVSLSVSPCLFLCLSHSLPLFLDSFLLTHSCSHSLFHNSHQLIFRQMHWHISFSLVYRQKCFSDIQNRCICNLLYPASTAIFIPHYDPSYFLYESFFIFFNSNLQYFFIRTNTNQITLQHFISDCRPYDRDEWSDVSCRGC